MQHRKNLAIKDGFSLVELTETDESGKVIFTAYEVYSQNCVRLTVFSDLTGARIYFKSLSPKPALEPHHPDDY